MKSRYHTLLEVSIGALAWITAACGHVPTTQSATAPNVHQEPQEVFVTGSRIAQLVDISTGLPATISPVRIYTRQDLTQTGRPELADALHQLDPALGTAPPRRP
jgi:hypothetical protein